MEQGVKAGDIPPPATVQPGRRSMEVPHVCRVRVLGMLGGLLGLLLVPSAQADTVNTESLGVVNGSIAARSQITEIRPFLSGRPLFQYEVKDGQPPLTTLVIERAQEVAGAGRQDSQVWIQQSLALSCPMMAGNRSVFQLPLQVEAAGQVVTVTVREDSRGLILTLPTPARQVQVRPAGAINFMLPATCRGDIRAEIRITGDTPDTGASAGG